MKITHRKIHLNLRSENLLFNPILTIKKENIIIDPTVNVVEHKNSLVENESRDDGRSVMSGRSGKSRKSKRSNK